MMPFQGARTEVRREAPRRPLSFVAAVEIIFAEDFTSSTVRNQEEGYLGGWFGASAQYAFGEWFGNTDPVGITAPGALAVLDNTDSFRSAGIILAPEIFGGVAGGYTLSFDLLSLVLSDEENGNPILGETHWGQVNIWSGAGYDLTQTTANALRVNSLGGTFEAEGTATVADLATTTLTAPGSGYTLQFDYDGVGAVGLFFGANRTAYPDLTVTYDNISVSRSVSVVPEPSTGLLGVLIIAGYGMSSRRRRSHQAPRQAH